MAGGVAALAFAVGLPVWVARSVARQPAAALRYVSGGEPETLDPTLATAALEVGLLGALYEGLVRIDPRTLAPVPAAAERIELDATGCRYTFRLRAGLRWSDGVALEARHFLYAWRRAADPRSGAPLQREAQLVASHARAVDGRTIRIVLERPWPSLPAVLTLPCFLPLRPEVVEAAPRRWTRGRAVPGCGPFVLARWWPGRGLRLERNPYYRRPARLASIEAITIGAAALGEATALRMYEAGEADLLFGVPAAARARLRGREDYAEGPRLGTVFLRCNLRRPDGRPTPLADVRVRRALALALDREALCSAALRGGGQPTRVLVPDGLGGYRSPGGLPEDAARARRLLAQAQAAGAAPRPLRFGLLYSAGDENARHGIEALQRRWAEVLGVQLSLEPTERKIYFQTMRRRDYDMAWGSWLADYPDPDNFLGIFRADSGNNRTGFADPRYEALLDEAQRTVDRKRRLVLLARAERRLLERAPCIPLYHTLWSWLRRPGLEGLVPNAMQQLCWERLGWAPGRGPR
ncbi:MAG: peptide ABC transporter substrate-binding protein [Planctomycetota bacterium]|nr:MAG: peptide ABC transporter substrate-binding protein [Planctomycetota bacterium]